MQNAEGQSDAFSYTFMKAPSSMARSASAWPPQQQNTGWNKRQFSGHAVHQGVNCDQCGELPITGIRYKCLNCSDYDICMKCEVSHPHDRSHVFAKIHTPVSGQFPVYPNFYGN